MPLKKEYKPGKVVRVWLSDIGVATVRILSYDGNYYKVEAVPSGKIYFVLGSEIL